MGHLQLSPCPCCSRPPADAPAGGGHAAEVGSEPKVRVLQAVTLGLDYWHLHVKISAPPYKGGPLFRISFQVGSFFVSEVSLWFLGYCLLWFMVIFLFDTMSFGAVLCIWSRHAVYSHMLILAGGVIQALFQGWPVRAPPQWAKDYFKWRVWDAAILLWRARAVNGADTDSHMWVGLGARELSQTPLIYPYGQSQGWLSWEMSKQTSELHARCRVKVLIREITLLQRSVVYSWDFCYLQHTNKKRP